MSFAYDVHHELTAIMRECLPYVVGVRSIGDQISDQTSLYMFIMSGGSILGPARHGPLDTRATLGNHFSNVCKDTTSTGSSYKDYIVTQSIVL
jgi:hypothetical protein